ncbi:Isonitrile hydratase [compost metagenome]
MQDRRALLKMMALSPGLAPLIASAAQAQDTLSMESPGAMPVSGERPVMDMDAIPADWFGTEQVGILIYDQMTALDVIGPQHFLAGLMGATIHLVARTDAPVTSDSGLVLTPTATFDSCPRDLDVLLAGGGMTGALAAMRDDATLDFLADRGARAGWVGSVCTGSLLLGQAGLLRGYRATSHWLGRPMLDRFGAIEVDQRVVIDRNRATGAGVSAGLDLGLELVKRLRPLDCAQTVQLMAEYAPEPPLDAGTPDRAPAAVVANVRDWHVGFTDAVAEAARSARS